MAATALSATGNDRIHPGANMSPFDLIVGEIEAFYAEAANWASDGFEIENQAQSDALDELDKALLAADKQREAIRVEEKRPLDDQVKAIQDRHNPIKDMVARARAALAPIRTNYKMKLAKAAADAAAKIEADKMAEIEALRAARAQTDGSLEAAEQIEQLETSVKMATKAAKIAVKAATVGTGLRTKWVAVMTDQRAAVAAMWKRNPQAFLDLAQELADAAARSGTRQIEGFTISEQKVAN